MSVACSLTRDERRWSWRTWNTLLQIREATDGKDPRQKSGESDPDFRGLLIAPGWPRMRALRKRKWIREFDSGELFDDESGARCADCGRRRRSHDSMTSRTLTLVPKLLSKQITFFGQAAMIACDGRCHKAWGISGRPKTKLSDDPDDFVYVGDQALGKAPLPGETVGYSEGGDIKPSATSLTDGEDMNRWCARECERCVMVKPSEVPRLPDLEYPAANKRPRYDVPTREMDRLRQINQLLQSRCPAGLFDLHDADREAIRRMFLAVETERSEIDHRGRSGETDSGENRTAVETERDDKGPR